MHRIDVVHFRLGLPKVHAKNRKGSLNKADNYLHIEPRLNMNLTSTRFLTAFLRLCGLRHFIHSTTIICLRINDPERICTYIFRQMSTLKSTARCSDVHDCF